MSSIFPRPPRIFASRSTTISPVVCAQCRRSFASSFALRSGHNRWSKIKHEKGAADAKKTAQRTTFAKHLTLYSKLYGPEPSLNSQLASVFAAAKKAGMPKATIDVAIARGQGKSSSGVGLENITVEVMMPPSVALVIDVETENKQRALQDIRTLVKRHKGTVTPTAFLFTRLGRSTLRGRKGDDFDKVLMQALDAGAEDVEQDENGDLVLWTQPNTTHQAAQNLSTALSTQIISSDIIWSPTADKIRLDDAEATTAIGNFVSALREYADVQGVYANAERGVVSEEIWQVVEENLDT
ncbi:YebC-like protein [Hypoxylon sp. NC1633]|nr:YebC-like protein [Hypoxylon sp. NC1633]